MVPPISANPSASEVKDARTLITSELLGEFPFASEADRAHALGLIILPFIRAAILGATPLHVIDKPTPGTGAGLFIDVFGIVTAGEPVTVMTEARDEDDWRKRIFSKLLTAPPAIIIDNITRRLDSAALSSAITATDYEDRVLGLSRMARVPVRCVWIATGNNVTVSNEVVRRTVRIRLDAKTDRPWMRDGFKQPDLRAWATKHRGELVWAALTLVQTWIAKGQPNGPKGLGGFDRWARAVGGILGAADVPGFLANAMEFYEQADAEGAAWRQFVTLWWDKFGADAVGTSDLWKLVAPEQGDAIDLGLGDLDKEKSAKTKLGRRLGTMRDRQFGELRLVTAGERQGAALWKLVKE